MFLQAGFRDFFIHDDRSVGGFNDIIFFFNFIQAKWKA